MYIHVSLHQDTHETQIVQKSDSNQYADDHYLRWMAKVMFSFGDVSKFRNVEDGMFNHLNTIFLLIFGRIRAC